MSCVWDLPKTDWLDPTTQIQVRAARFMEEPIPTAPKSKYHSISGYDPSAVALRAEKLRISDFLEKPFSRDIICNAVKKAIGSPPANPPATAASESERGLTSRNGTF